MMETMKQKIINGLDMGLFTATTLVLMASVLAGCTGWGKTACTIVDAA
jgi:hypothetical protein